MHYGQPATAQLSKEFVRACADLVVNLLGLCYDMREKNFSDIDGVIQWHKNDRRNYGNVENWKGVIYSNSFY